MASVTALTRAVTDSSGIETPAARSLALMAAEAASSAKGRAVLIILMAMLLGWTDKNNDLILLSIVDIVYYSKLFYLWSSVRSGIHGNFGREGLIALSIRAPGIYRIDSAFITYAIFADDVLS